MEKKHIGISKEDLLKQFEGFKKGLRKLGEEGFKISGRVEQEIERGARAVRLVFEVERLQREMAKVTNKIGLEVCRLDAERKLADPTLKAMVREVDAFAREIEKKKNEIDRLKRAKGG